MKSAHILLVEDNPDDISLTLRAFKKNKIVNEVVIAQDGEEALDYLFARNAYAARDISDLPAVVLLDLKLPKVSGLDVLKSIRHNARTRLLRVVVLTTSNEDIDVFESYNLGATSYIRKPVDFDAFMTAVGQLGSYWLLLNESPNR